MKELSIENKKITISHSDKILFPENNITKAQLVDYYHKISDYILPYIRDRPLTLHCFPRGIQKEGFFRQHAPKNLPNWFETIDLEKKEGGKINHILCQNKASLIYLINQNTITIHRWLSTIHNPEIPDLLVIDIDIPDKSYFSLACKAAKLLKNMLENKKYSPYVMTTGSKGLHVLSKVKNAYTSFDELRDMLKEITYNIAKNYPDEFSIDVRKEQRKNLVYLDISRNTFGQTAVSPFSVRAKEAATIATLLDWKELDMANLKANLFNISNIWGRL